MTYTDLYKRFDLKVPKDKIQHFIVSLILTLLLGYGTAITIGICKELYDKFSGKGTPCWYDLTADLLGCLSGLIIRTSMF